MQYIGIDTFSIHFVKSVNIVVSIKKFSHNILQQHKLFPASKFSINPIPVLVPLPVYVFKLI